MFFEKNKRLLMGAGGVAVLWLILYYTLVSPNWAKASAQREQATRNRETWENTTKNDKAKKEAESRHNEYKPVADATEDLKETSLKTERKFKEMQQIEFGTRQSLKAFSTQAAGERGDVNELQRRKQAETVARIKKVLKSEILPEELSVKFNEGAANVPLNLLRLAMVDRFVSACGNVRDDDSPECKIQRIVKVDYEKPKKIEPPIEKSKADDDEDSKGVGASGKKKKADKDADKAEALDPLWQLPMKVLVRVTADKYGNMLLFELQKPTPREQEGEDQHAYFCVRGFHLTTRDNLPNALEVCVGICALMRESELKAMGVSLKTEDGRDVGGEPTKDARDPF